MQACYGISGSAEQSLSPAWIRCCRCRSSPCIRTCGKRGILHSTRYLLRCWRLAAWQEALWVRNSITLGTLIYTVCKKRIPTKHIGNKAVIFSIGIVLGMMSSFLGIGGGPINLVVLFYFFSMETKFESGSSLPHDSSL